ncbi:hypothetical protein D3C86_1152640 [compost metagenome]
MIDTRDNEVDQIANGHKTAAIGNTAQRQRNAFTEPVEHIAKVGLYPWTINKGRANDHDFKSGFSRQRLERFFSLELGETIGIARIRFIICLERYSACRRLAIDLDRTDENKPLHTRLDRTTRQIKRALDIHSAILAQGICRRFMHHMHASRGMHNNIHVPERRELHRLAKTEPFNRAHVA